jgi:drug/metabolite transporter (DMT)-like permease
VASINSTAISQVDGHGGSNRLVGPGVQTKVGAGDYLCVALMVLIGSTTAPAAKYVVRELPVFLIPVLRFALAGLCLLPVVWARGGLGRLIREDGWGLLLAAVLCIPLNQFFFLSATRLGPTSHVGLFYATCPLVVLLLAWGMRLERPDLSRLWGVLTSVAGIAVIAIGNLWEQGGTAAGADRGVLLADLLLLGAVLSWGGYIAVSKPLIVRHGAIPVLAGTFLAGCLLSIPIAWIASPGLPQLRDVSATAWLGLAFLSLFVTPFGWAYQNLALRRFDATQVATFSNAAPILTVIWGMSLFGETVTPSLVLGGAMTLGGIYWICRPAQAAPEVPRARSETSIAASRASGERRPACAVLAGSEEQDSR